jgi:hypothetical protein
MVDCHAMMVAEMVLADIKNMDMNTLRMINVHMKSVGAKITLKHIEQKGHGYFRMDPQAQGVDMIPPGSRLDSSMGDDDNVHPPKGSKVKTAQPPADSEVTFSFFFVRWVITDLGFFFTMKFMDPIKFLDMITNWLIVSPLLCINSLCAILTASLLGCVFCRLLSVHRFFAYLQFVCLLTWVSCGCCFFFKHISADAPRFGSFNEYMQYQSLKKEDDDYISDIKRHHDTVRSQRTAALARREDYTDFGSPSKFRRGSGRGVGYGKPNKDAQSGYVLPGARRRTSETARPSI